ncbi:hypothetical protein L6452_20052 [Arctium lappa]|uniref:Uncharacterized protein n=1 Tax=Arctium lappa TaxID=4217 RepID=A0ACB9BAN4_ARCLA|nr:hypothetical protein L6452_20052 [Arctium lappa]
MSEGLPKSANKSSPMPRRSPPPPPTAQPVPTSRTEGTGGPIGAFWTTQHGKDSAVVEELSKVKFDEEITGAERNRSERFSLHRTSPPKDEAPHAPRPSQKTVQGKSGPSKDFEMNFFQDGPSHAIERSKAKSNDAFNAFATEFGVNKLSPGRSNVNTGKEEQLEAEVERLKEQLKQVNLEKSELSSKYEKLSAICRSQRQELHELKQTLASRTPSPNKSASKTQSSPGTQHQSPSQQFNTQQKDGITWEQQKGLFDKSSPSSDQNSWQAFPEAPTLTNNSKSVRTRNGHQNKQGGEVVGGNNSWSFGAESFTAVPAAAASPQVNVPSANLNNSQRSGESKNKESKLASQPAGWAGF